MMTAPHPSFSLRDHERSRHASTALGSSSPVPTFWKQTLSSTVVAGLLGATLLAMAGAIEIARAFTQPPQVGAEIENALSGILVVVFLVAAFAHATRLRTLGPVCILSVYTLIAHGGALVLGGHVVGAMFLGMAPLIAVCGRATMADGWADDASKIPVVTDRPATPPTAPAAEPAASPSHVITLR